MKVYISADIEGTCGITVWDETEKTKTDDYKYFGQQMTREVRAACDGAISGGADNIFIKDAHDTARNLDPSKLPACARILRGWTGDPLSMMSGVDGGFDVAFMTGYHAWAACSGNPLSHTMNLGNEYTTLNGVRMSEFMLNAFTAGYYGVPVAFLSGDRALCEFARTLVPEITAVPVNEGIGGGVVSIQPDVAVERIQAGAEQAVKKAARCKVKLPDHFDAVVRFREHPLAYSKSFYPGATLEDSKNVCFSSNDWFEMLRFYHFVLSD
ncbi:MAG: M55 family metallopeptidase [Intestinimonas sp.]|jgi:D-amino peptidase|nr:M55 family metallopeptidase [Intestinimonas sp.]